MSIYFVNEGLIDLTAIITFGVSAKETENPFGYFGTGFKYAIAIMLRDKQKITLFRGNDIYTFSSVTKEIRGQSFDIVKMNDIELGFTTDLGKNWKLWQAFRELYCNAMDEKGYVTNDDQQSNANNTVIKISGYKFEDLYANMDKIIIKDNPLYILKDINIHKGPGEYIYYQTIRVHNAEISSYFTYNIKTNLSLTEDRTLNSIYDFYAKIKRNVISGDNKQFIKEFITVPQNTLEAEMEMYGYEPSKAFIEVIEKIDFKEISNRNILDIYQKHKNIVKVPKTYEMSNIEKQQLDIAINFIADLFEYDVSRYKINVSDELKHNVLGMVYDKEIYLSRRVFQQGTKQVTATLLEEFLHIYKGFADETYDFQTFLFDMVITMGEKINGKPI